MYAIDLLVDELFTDLAGLEEDGPTVADSDAAFMILEDLPPHLAHEYTVLFTRRLVVTAITLTARLTQAAPFRPSCTAEELLLRALLTQAEVTADLYGLLDEEVSTALELFAEAVYAPALAPEDEAREAPEAPEASDGRAEQAPAPASAPADSVDTWFTPFTPSDRVHPYAANEDEEDEEDDETDGAEEADGTGETDESEESLRRKPD